MISFLNKSNIIVIKKSSIDIFLGSKDPQIINFTPSDSLEDIKVEEISKNLSEYLKSNKIKSQNFLVYLSPEIVFSKIIAPSPDQETAILKFLEEVPLPAEKLGKNIHYTKEAIIASTTNKLIYETVLKTLEDQGNKIISIVAPNQNELEDIQKTANNSDLIKNGDFLNAVFQNSQSKQQNILLPIIIIIFILLAGAGLYYLLKNASPIKKTAPVSPVISITPVPTPTIITKKDLKVQILNGTGTAGDAGKVAKALEAIGYINITTGNSQTPATLSAIIISPKVTPELANEIANRINNLFTKTATMSSNLLSNYDIVIITGK